MAGLRYKLQLHRHLGRTCVVKRRFRCDSPSMLLIRLTRGMAMAAVLLAGLSCTGSNEVDFNRDIRPILNERCVACHGGIRRQGDLNLLFRAEALLPGKSGKAAIVPFDAGASELMQRVSHVSADERMPQENDPLTDKEVRLLGQWIDDGAPWDPHWAYVAPQNLEIPAVSDPSWPRRPLDTFILARIDEEGLTPSMQADCPTLLRRVSLDLVGLPPAAEHVLAACTNPDTVDYEAFVDNLLASPQFGERWASMWLDLARYADSKGYEKDIPRTIWRYRDWVIRAFNADMPFDQFTIEQLAGDLLPTPTEEQLVATAFHRNTMTNTEGGTDDEEFRVAAVIDRVNTTWEVWQGTSFGCVQCHGHPYDPFRHEDYYQFFAFFNNTEDWDQDNEMPTMPHFEAADREAGEALLAEIRELEDELRAAAAEPDVTAARRVWEDQLDDPEVVGQVPGRSQNEVRRIVAIPVEERDIGQEAFLNAIYAEITPDPRISDLRKVRGEKQQALAALEPVLTPIMRELPARRQRSTYVFERGSFLLKGNAVTAGVPAALPEMPPETPRNRLGLAQWLVSMDNPLTARVMVNRFWEQLFGAGIVESLEDFGTQGEPPSHPELLDHLAITFMHEYNWSMKAIIKDIVTSATYRQSSAISRDLLERDPRNRLLARGPRFRLSAEQIRDQALAVSGLLSDRMYGPSVKPPQPDGLWQNPYDNTRWETSTDDDRYRRGLYTYWRRTVPYPSMATFDSPSREFCVSRRVRTNTPLQALVSLNDPVFVEAAQALARRMVDEATDPDPDAQLTTGYELALAHSPTVNELASLRALYDKALDHYGASPDDAYAISGGYHSAELAATTVAANAILNLDAFVMKQ